MRMPTWPLISALLPGVQCGGKLEASMTGPVFEVFARTLRGLSGAKITRPGAFKNAAQDGFAVRCSYKVRALHVCVMCVVHMRACTCQDPFLYTCCLATRFTQGASWPALQLP